MKKGFYIAAMVLATLTANAQIVASHANTSMKAAPAGMAKAVMAPAMQVSGKPVARVNGAELLDRDLLREMFTIFPYAQQHSGFPKQLEPEIRRGALEMIIFEELVYQEAKRHNLAVPAAKLASAEKEFRNQFGSNEAYRQFLQSETNGSESAMRGTVQVFDKPGQLLYVFGGRGTALGRFQLPTGVFIQTNDRVYVVDSYNRRVQVFQYHGLKLNAQGGQP